MALSQLPRAPRGGHTPRLPSTSPPTEGGPVTPEETPHAEARSSGRRRITPTMLKTRQAVADLPLGQARKGDHPGAQARWPGPEDPPQGAGVRDLSDLGTFACDWEPGATPIAAPSNADIAAELEIERTQIKALGRAAADSACFGSMTAPPGSAMCAGKRQGVRSCTAMAST